MTFLELLVDLSVLIKRTYLKSDVFVKKQLIILLFSLNNILFNL